MTPGTYPGLASFPEGIPSGIPAPGDSTGRALRYLTESR